MKFVLVFDMYFLGGGGRVWRCVQEAAVFIILLILIHRLLPNVTD
jgi:hypothetical protein